MCLHCAWRDRNMMFDYYFSESVNKSKEIEETNCFIQESIEGTIEKIISEEAVDDPNSDTTRELGK